MNPRARPRSRTIGAALTSLLVSAVFASGCGSAPTTQAYDVVSVGALAAGAPIPTPREEPVLHLRGDLGAANSGADLALDLPTLEQLGLVRYAVDDPWLERRVSYTGVLLADLVRAARPRATATTLRIVALDDYAVEIPLADVERWPVLLATRIDGERMTVENGGPTRIVFPYGLVDGIDEAAAKPLWIWSIATITVL